MRTAIVSDLHIGSSSREDVLRDASIRRSLFEEIGTADRFVLLGDTVEMRDLPLGAALEAARPFFEELGEAMAGRPVLMLPGNHDHRLADPLLDQRSAGGGQPLGLEARYEPRSGPASRIAGWLGRAELEMSYPGVWLRDDVFAMHGHYMDCHLTLPRGECIGIRRGREGDAAAARSGEPRGLRAPAAAALRPRLRAGAVRRSPRSQADRPAPRSGPGSGCSEAAPTRGGGGSPLR